MSDFVALALASSASISSDPRSLNELSSFLNAAILPLFLGALGGLIRTLKRRHGHMKGWPKFCAITSDILSSAFTGWMVHLGTGSWDLDADTRAMMIGVSGYAGTVILDALASIIERKLEAFGCETKKITHHKSEHVPRPNKKSDGWE